MDGLSSRNLLFMRSFAAAYPDMRIVKQLVSQLPWGHVIRLLQRIKDPDIRHWYVTESIAHGWSRNILEIQIDTCAHERQGKAITNFEATLPPTDSDMAAQVFKDPYLFDFLLQSIGGISQFLPLPGDELGDEVMQSIEIDSVHGHFYPFFMIIGGMLFGGSFIILYCYFIIFPQNLSPFSFTSVKVVSI